MAIGENLADFHPTIGEEERVVEDAGLLTGDDSHVAAVAAQAVPDALPAPAGATEPEGSKQ
jgi:hypothetical protein